MATTTTSSSGNTGSGADKDTRWYFTAEQLANSPSRRQGIDADQELSFRQLTAYLIQEMGQRLQVSQLCINTAIVYMHRFYAFHSFTHFHRNGIAAASLFLAAKVEEQPRKLEHVIKVAHICLNQEPPHPSTKMYAEQAQDLVFNENVLLQTLGFDVAIDHPHTHVVKTCHLVKACKDLAQTSYFLASNSLHLTSMCLQYRPTVVACFCIYLACKWSRWEIPQSTEGKHWFHYVDKTVTMDLLQQLTDEFIIIYEKSPARLKSKLNSIKALAQSARIPEPSRSDSANGSNASQLEQLTPIQTQPSSSSRRDPSSHHRPHHSSTSHHHHSKHAPPPVDPGDHKHKPPFPPSSSSSHSNRPRTDRTQNSTTTSIVNDSSQYPIAKQSSTRPSTGSNRPQQIIPPSSSQTATVPVQPIVTQSSVSANVSSGQRLIHGHEQSGSQHHKSRSSSSSNNSNNNAPQLNPLINTSINHTKTISTKSSSEQLNRSNTIVRDATNKFQIPSTKHGSGNVNNSNSGNSNIPGSMYPPAATSVHQNHSGSSNVLDIRNMLSQQQQQNPQTTVTSSQNRSFIQNSQTIPNYQQQQQQQQLALGNRGSNSNNNSNKYDQSVQQPLLVNMQQQQQQHHQQQQQHQLNQKQQQSLESSSIISPFNISNDPMSGGGGGLIKNIGAGDQMDICSPPKYSTSHQPTFIQNSQQQQQPQQNSASNKSFSSIFSPDWNDKQNNNPIINQNNINNIGNNNSNNKLSLNFNTKTNRDSPKKSDKEKRSGTPKKDKRNNNNIIIDQQQQQQRNSKQITSSGMQQHQLQQQNLNYIPQQTHALNFSSGTKRPLPSNDNNNSNNNINNINIKLEEELMRETKVRKLEPIDIKPPPYLFDQSSSSIQNMGNISNNNSNSSFHYQQQQLQQHQDIKSKQQFNAANVVNGSIETNPDLVSSLLKESLCNENKFSSHITPTEPSIIKTESIPSSIIKTESSPLLLMNPNDLTLTLPQQLLQDSPPPSQSIASSSINIKQESLISCSSVAGGGGGGTSSNDEYSKTKTEKKKKKDKHKHKEKDKTKDKEERKKHKKDKDKHKERDRTSSGIGGVTATIGNMDNVELLTNEQNNPVKIKISKDKLNLPSLIDSSGNNIVGSGGAINSGQFKIKIPKDRIKGEMNAFSNNDDSTVTGGIGMGGQNYQNQTVPQVNSLKIKFFKDKGENYSQDNSSFHGNSSIGGAGGGHGNNISGSGISSSGSSKKKDRDRDRDKEKKRNSSDKQNGGNNGGSGSTTTSTKTQSNSSKIHSQLFGESNDDDDDFDDVPMTTLNNNQFNNKQYKSTSLSSSNHLYSYQQQQQQQSRSSGSSGGGGYSYSDIKKYNNNNSSSSQQQQLQQQHQYQQNYK